MASIKNGFHSQYGQKNIYYIMINMKTTKLEENDCRALRPVYLIQVTEASVGAGRETPQITHEEMEILKSTVQLHFKGIAGGGKRDGRKPIQGRALKTLSEKQLPKQPRQPRQRLRQRQQREGRLLEVEKEGGAMNTNGEIGGEETRNFKDMEKVLSRAEETFPNMVYFRLKHGARTNTSVVHILPFNHLDIWLSSDLKVVSLWHRANYNDEVLYFYISSPSDEVQ
ncbi:hypothetical protein A6R68_02726, partial [Neotoma lepida]